MADLKGEWECGVVEISYPQIYYNVEDGKLSLTKIMYETRNISDNTIKTLTLVTFFYCNVLTSQAVGDVQAPLLTVLPNKKGEMFEAIIAISKTCNILKWEKIF